LTSLTEKELRIQKILQDEKTKPYGVFSNSMAKDIFDQKYNMDQQETWSVTSRRVVEGVCGQYLDNETKERIYNLILERKFIPGGRYLYSTGRAFHQVNNCFLFRAEDSRESWADTMQKITAALMTGGGIGVDYSKLRPKGAKISRTGGESTGPLALMHMVNEAGRHIMQGGQRRSAIWAGLNWSHKDVEKFLKFKDWSQDLKKLKEKDFNFPLSMELTNISVVYDTEFFIAIEDKKHEKHKLAKKTWIENCKQAFRTAEPGMAFNFLKDNESLRNAPVTSRTRVLTREGYQSVGDIVNQEVYVWTGIQWAKTAFKKTKENANLVKVELTNGRHIVCDPEHPFIVKNYKGNGMQRKVELERVAAASLNEDQKIQSDLPLKTISNHSSHFNSKDYSEGFVFGDGSIRKGRGEISFHDDSKKPCFQICLEGFLAKTKSLDNRAYFKTEFNNKDELLNKAVLKKEFIAGWFDANGCYTRNLLRLSNSDKQTLIKCQESLDFYGIKSTVRRDGSSSYKSENPSHTLTILSSSLLRFSQVIKTVRLDINVGNEYLPYRESEIRIKEVKELNHKEDVYCCDVKVEEHSFMAEGVIISNCTEVTSEDDSDKCNLGTLWINRFDNKEEFAQGTKDATLFLLCGGLYSHVPTDKIREIGSKNNRIGLGLGGIHEWLMTRGSEYEVTPELHKWLNIYEQESDASAHIGSKDLGVNIPKGKRAIAPTGTIGILAETTTGIEPLFCKSYKRRYLKGEKWHYQYVVDGTVKRLLEKGVKLENIKDAYDISFKDRVKFQADVQNYVDMAISSTCNLPPWGSEENNEENVDKKAKILLKYAKRLRGFTCYPDGSRGGQPLTRVELDDALKQEGQVFEENEHECIGGVCGV